MSTPPQKTEPHRREEIEAWWPLVARILGFAFGAFLIYGQAQAPNPPGAQEWVIVAGIGCMGPTVATAVATVLEAARGSLPPPKEPPAIDPPPAREPT